MKKVKVINKTKKKIISSNAGLADNFSGRCRGLMFSAKKDIVLASDKERNFSIHMFFVEYPIDAIWLDSQNNVIHVERGIRPLDIFSPGTWKVYGPKKRARCVVEISLGDTSGTEIGDRIEFIYQND